MPEHTGPEHDPQPTLPGQDRFVASVEETPLQEVDVLDTSAPPVSQWKDAWMRLRGNTIFWISAVLLAILAIVLIAPGLFTNADPEYCNLIDSLEPSESGHPFGYNQQGCDVWARALYGARVSVVVGLLTAIVSTLIGVVTGAVAGFYGGWADALISRISDIFFAIPLILAAIVMLSVFKNVNPDPGYWAGILIVVAALALFAWPQITRQMRGAVLEVKNLEFVDAAKAIGASPRANLVRHVVPNALAPVIVTATINLGIFIVAEATLSFLGIGVANVVSWGGDISDARVLVRAGDDLRVMFVPAAALALTSLAFILLGDAVRDALDPKARSNR